jgi:hypothetical protein
MELAAHAHLRQVSGQRAHAGFCDELAVAQVQQRQRRQRSQRRHTRVVHLSPTTTEPSEASEAERAIGQREVAAKHWTAGRWGLMVTTEPHLGSHQLGLTWVQPARSSHVSADSDASARAPSTVML